MARVGNKAFGPLLLFVLIVPLFAWGILHSFLRSPTEPDRRLGLDRARLIRDLDAARPEIVITGDSMLFTRMEPKKLAAVSGRRVAFLCNSGAASLVWYLYLKNVILPMQHPPQTVVMLFRDQLFSQPTSRTVGIYAPYIESLRENEEPLADALLSQQPGESPVRRVENFLASARGLGRFAKLRGGAEDGLHALAMDLSTLGDGKSKRNQAMNTTFAVRNLRHDLPADLGDSAEKNHATDGAPEPATFDPAPEASFLPAMVQMARARGVQLILFRVKRRPNSQNIRRESPEVQRYMAELRLWSQRQGVLFFDETADASIPLSAYADGDHLAPEQMDWYTRYFWQRLEPVLR